MKSDQSLSAVLIGAVSTIPDEILTQVLVASGIGKYSVYHLASLITTLNRPDYFLGIILSSEVGGMMAVFFYYYLRKLGPKCLLIKGLMVGLVGWTFLELLFTGLIEGPHLIPPRPISQMFGALLWGLSMALLFKRYLFKKPAGSQTQ